MTIDSWRTLLLGAVAIGQTLFVSLYATFPWWRSFLGKALFFKALALGILVDMYMIYRLFPFPHADVVFVVLYAMLAAGVWFQFFAFLRVRLEHREAQTVSGNGKHTHTA